MEQGSLSICTLPPAVHKPFQITLEIIWSLGVGRVRQLLPPELQERQQKAADLDTKELLLNTARHFLASVYKIRGGGVHGRGRRTDVARNAMAAGLAQLLPASLFQSRHGRAACRILGISYRQARPQPPSCMRAPAQSRRGCRGYQTGAHHPGIALVF